jgi:hypothetical protein
MLIKIRGMKLGVTARQTHFGGNSQIALGALMIHAHEVKLPARFSPKEFVICVLVAFFLYFVALNVPEDTGNWLLVAFRYVGLASGIMGSLLVINVVFGRVKIARKRSDAK